MKQTPDFGGHKFKVEGMKTGTSTEWVGGWFFFLFFYFLSFFFCLRGGNPHILVMGLMEMLRETGTIFLNVQRKI